MARILLVLILLVPAAHALAAFASVVPESCVQECAGGACPGEESDETCPPLCTDCSCCAAAHFFLPSHSAGLDPLACTSAFTAPTEGLRIGAREREIFHVPKSIA